MAINDKDQKLLWAKAAGRCSMCKKELSVEANSPSGNTLIGQNCHIIGEKLHNGPRHKSNLSEKDRNRYPNLILLCSNHHIEIDGDEKKYSVEILHQIKADHEIWVQQALTQNDDTTSNKLYSDLINYITEKISLYHWEWLTDHSIRTIMLDESVIGMRDTVIRITRVNWPNENVALEQAIIELCEKLEEYINHYTSFAHPRSETDWIEDKQQYNDSRTGFSTEEGIKQEKKDYHSHFVNLWNLTVAINIFARVVRKSFNKEYFFLQGDFVMHDEQGVTNSIESCVYFPNEYKS